MLLMQVYEFNGTWADEIEVPPEIFNVAPHRAAIHQTVVAHLANRRQGTANTKTRGDVSGGGKKPWRQKHTGRARQGSTRSPIWVHGGVAHGPHTRDYHQKVNRKVKQLAMKCILSDRFREERLVVVKGFNDITKPSTRAIRNLIISLSFDLYAGSTLVVYTGDGLNISKSVSNLRGARCLNVASLNVYDVLRATCLILTPEALARIQEVYSR